MEQNNFGKSLKYLSIPTIFLGNLLVFVLGGYLLDKYFDIGTILFMVIIIVGFIFSIFSTYKVFLKLDHE